ncbi:MAG: prolyl oligopeptidase family serine peptidase [Pirellulales bacterium]|nr:prolyl oligopeptidase family serine peptidase [Pirellulales bacterium]
MRNHRLVLIVVLAVALASLPALLCVAAESGTSSKIEPDVVYGHKDGLAMTMDVLRPEGEANRAGILFMVSGGWYSRWAPPERMQLLFVPYLNKGYTVFLVRHGSSPRYSIPEAVADVRQAVRFVRKNADRFGVDVDRLGAMGMSAGGHLALMLGTTGEDGAPGLLGVGAKDSSRVAAVVALVPPTDLRVAVWSASESLPAYRRFPALDLPMEKAKENSPLVHVTPDDAPALVIMGEKDDLVSPKHGQRIDAAFDEKHVAHKLIILPGATHNLMKKKENRATVVREALDWFDKHLLQRPKQ